MTELMIEWISVSKERPPEKEPVLVWYQGRPAVGRFQPQSMGSGSLHDWLIYPAGACPVSPYPQYYPKWWMPMIAAPSNEPVAWGPPTDFGEIHVVWRGSVTDLYTDLFPLLTPPQLSELGRKLIGQLGGHVERMARADSRQPTADSSGSGQEPRARSQEPSVPVPMLLRCPSCNERHIDEGEFALKPHHTHACQICGEVWRPAIVATVGVHFLPGFKNARAS